MHKLVSIPTHCTAEGLQCAAAYRLPSDLVEAWAPSSSRLRSAIPPSWLLSLTISTRWPFAPAWPMVLSVSEKLMVWALNLLRTHQGQQGGPWHSS